MKKLSIVSRSDVQSNKIKKELIDRLSSQYEYDAASPDLVISVGGDGTVLKAVHQYLDQLDHVVFIGLHTGTLGFLTDYNRDELDLFISDLLSDNYTTYDRNIVVCKTDHDEFLGLNEIRLESSLSTQILDIYVNDEYLETFRGSGLCISTASGSTAYNKTLGGAIVYSSAGIMQLTEIQGISNNAYRSLNSPIIFDKNHTIHIHNVSENPLLIGCDHLAYPNYEVKDLYISIASFSAKFLSMKHVSLIDRLRKSFI